MSSTGPEVSSYAAWTIGLAILAIPPIYIYISRALATRKLQKTGIGKGAPGFLTSVKRIAVTPDIAARMRRGDEISPEEIAASQARAAVASQQSSITTASPLVETLPSLGNDSTSTDNEWLPDHLKKSDGKRKTTKGKRK